MNVYPLRGWDEGTVDQLLAGVAEGRRAGWADQHWRERDEALFDLLVTLSPRRAEVCGLDVGDYSGRRKERRLLFRGKGNKERVLPVPFPTVIAIDRSLATQRTCLKRWRPFPTDPLFVGSPTKAEKADAMTDGGRRITPAQVTHIVERLLAEYGLSGKKPDGALVHALRHTFGTQLVDSGVTLSEAADLLGHAPTATTKGYTEVTGGAKRDPVEHSPAARSLAKLQGKGS